MKIMVRCMQILQNQLCAQVFFQPEPTQGPMIVGRVADVQSNVAFTLQFQPKDADGWSRYKVGDTYFVDIQPTTTPA